jgi:hypothetical protein
MLEKQYEEESVRYSAEGHPLRMNTLGLQSPVAAIHLL